MLAEWMTEFRQGRITDIIEGRSRRLVSFPAVRPDSRQRRLSFGLALHQLTEVLLRAPLKTIPDSPSWVPGLLTWRRQPLPVIDLSQLFGLPPTEQNNDTRLLILRSLPGAPRVALLAVGTPHLVRLPTPHLSCERDLPLSLVFALGAVEIYGETVVIPNLPLILGEISELAPRETIDDPPLPEFGPDAESPEFLP